MDDQHYRLVPCVWRASFLGQFLETKRIKPAKVASICYACCSGIEDG